MTKGLKLNQQVCVLPKGLAKWRSRRGMKELDLFLVNFTENHYESLSTDQKLVYERLLQEEDQSLWDWLLEIQSPSSLEYQVLLKDIKKIYISYKN